MSKETKCRPTHKSSRQIVVYFTRTESYLQLEQVRTCMNKAVILADDASDINIV
jgi:hypothetical protein